MFTLKQPQPQRGVLLSLRNIGPNWFGSVMGTGIVAVCAGLIPAHEFPVLHGLGWVFWAIAVVLGGLVSAATLLHWIFFPAVAIKHHDNPAMAYFYGAPPMGLATVGAATTMYGSEVFGQVVAVNIGFSLWIVSCIAGLFVALWIPYLAFTRHAVTLQDAGGPWLMPVVTPMVSAATGAAYLPYLPDGEVRLNFLLFCYGLFGITAVMAFIVITLIWQRLVVHKFGAAATVPTLFIVLGPLGQSVNAANLLGMNAHLAVRSELAVVLQGFGVVYGVPVIGFACAWAVIACMIAVRALRSDMQFNLGWWSFTFPVGTCVAGCAALWHNTESELFGFASQVGYVLLVTFWTVVAVRTVRGLVVHKNLLS